MISKRALSIYCRGLAMGAADVVPGVSGGTIAFITGIYEELLDSIKAINPAAVITLFKQGPAAFWQQINGGFLLALGLGIVTSILSLARLISHLLETQPLLLWSFFFGLIAASALHMARQVKQWDALKVLTLLSGAALALAIAEIKPSELPAEPLFVFAAGAIAICAMILPGISGSFILVLLGMYAHVLSAIKNFEWLVLITFAAGCGIGLLCFSQLLSYLFKRFHDLTMTLLTGFLLGSLTMVWPWKQTISSYQNSHGKTLALEQQNVLPSFFSQLGEPAQTVPCLLLAVVGLALVFLLERFGGGGAAKKVNIEE